MFNRKPAKKTAAVSLTFTAEVTVTVEVEVTDDMRDTALAYDHELFSEIMTDFKDQLNSQSGLNIGAMSEPTIKLLSADEFKN